MKESHMNPVDRFLAAVLAVDEGGIPHAARQARVIRVRDDVIVSDVVWCGGRWPVGLLAEMAQASHG
jgi:hypothetical protein